MPANVEASIIRLRASMSEGSSIARMMLSLTISIARLAHTSLMGLEPW